jgi:hypothetical protein
VGWVGLLEMVRRPKWQRLILLSGRKRVGAKILDKFLDDGGVTPVGSPVNRNKPSKLKNEDEVGETMAAAANLEDGSEENKTEVVANLT